MKTKLIDRLKNNNKRQDDANKVLKTKSSYGFLWSRNKLEGCRGTPNLPYHFSAVREVLPFALPDKATVLDAGCGNGADLLAIAQNEDYEVVGLDITKEGTAQAYRKAKGCKNVSILQADLQYLPFRDSIFDIIYSYGVLHHTPAPKENFLKLVNLLKPGGVIIIYLYEKFDTKTRLEQNLLEVITRIRKVTIKLPPPLLFGLCLILSPLVFLCCVLPYRIIKNIGSKNPEPRIPFRHCKSWNPFSLTGDLYDRFSAQFEFRFNEAEVRNWFKEAKLKDIGFRNLRGWVYWGFKQEPSYA